MFFFGSGKIIIYNGLIYFCAESSAFLQKKCKNKTFLELQLKDNLLVSFISRKGRIFIPTGQDMIHVGDEVMIVTTHTGFKDITDILA